MVEGTVETCQTWDIIVPAEGHLLERRDSLTRAAVLHTTTDLDHPLPPLGNPGRVAEWYMQGIGAPISENVGSSPTPSTEGYRPPEGRIPLSPKGGPQ